MVINFSESSHFVDINLEISCLLAPSGTTTNKKPDCLFTGTNRFDSSSVLVKSSANFVLILLFILFIVSISIFRLHKLSIICRKIAADYTNYIYYKFSVSAAATSSVSLTI